MYYVVIFFYPDTLCSPGISYINIFRANSLLALYIGFRTCCLCVSIAIFHPLLICLLLFIIWFTPVPFYVSSMSLPVIHCVHLLPLLFAASHIRINQLPHTLSLVSRPTSSPLLYRTIHAIHKILYNTSQELWYRMQNAIYFLTQVA